MVGFILGAEATAAGTFALISLKGKLDGGLRVRGGDTSKKASPVDVIRAIFWCGMRGFGLAGGV